MMNTAAESSESSFFVNSMNPMAPHSGRRMPPLRQRSVSSSSHSTLNNSLSGSRNNSPLPHESPLHLPTTVSVDTTPLHRNTSLLEHTQSFSSPGATSRFSHTTPRTSNGKRRASNSQQHSQQLGSHSGSSNSMVFQRSSSTSSFDCQVIQHSLKRVRLSSSPGELRLNTDLKHLTHHHPPHQQSAHQASAPTLPPTTSTWIQVHDDEWTNPATGSRLVRCPVDPLRLFVHSADGRTCVSLQIPRMYPHSPPVVTRQGNFEGGGQYSMDATNDGLQELRAQLHEWWSPVKSLVHALDFLQPALTTTMDDAVMMGSGFQPGSHSQQQQDSAMGEHDDATLTSTAQVFNAFLPPNRFEAYRSMGETMQWANQTIHHRNDHLGTFGGLMDTNE